MTSVSRMLDFIEFKGMKKTALYKQAGISNGYFDKVKELGADKIESILSVFPQLNLNWLITGKGEMETSIGTGISSLPVVNQNKNELVKAPSGRLPKRRNAAKLINFYDVDFAAGDIEFYDDTNAIKPAYTMDIPEFNGCTAFRTYSNSMENLIHSGDILFGTNVEDWQSHLEFGQIYGIVCKDRRKYLKYLRKDKEKPETHFLLRSENSDEYDDFSIPKDKIKGLWLIHGWINKRV